jgi:hypothetical protein
MTTRWPCAAIVSLCGLLAVATSAHAECAWVVWVGESWLATYKQDERPALWTLVEAYPLLANCQQAQDAKIKTLSNRDGVEVHGNVVTKTFPSGYNRSNVTRSVRVICVPDTVDPRGPKGKP